MCSWCHKMKLKFKNNPVPLVHFFCFTEKRYVSLFFTRLWFVIRIALVFRYTESWNFRISTAHAHKYETKRQAKMRNEDRIKCWLVTSIRCTWKAYSLPQIINEWRKSKCSVCSVTIVQGGVPHMFYFGDNALPHYVIVETNLLLYILRVKIFWN